MRLWDRLLKPATFDAINLSCDLRLIFMAIQLRLFMTFTRAAVSIKRMKWTLTLQAASLHGPKITEQMSQKIACEVGPLRRFSGTLGESILLPHPFRVPWVNTACRDGTNSPIVSATIFETFFFNQAYVILFLFRSLLLPLYKMGVTIILLLLSPDIDECTSGTDDCHSSLASCTNTVGSFSCACNNPSSGNGRTCNLPSGNEKDIFSYQTRSYSLVIDAPCADLDCLNSALLSIFIEVWEDSFWDPLDHRVITGNTFFFAC